MTASDLREWITLQMDTHPICRAASAPRSWRASRRTCRRTSDAAPRLIVGGDQQADRVQHIVHPLPAAVTTARALWRDQYLDDSVKVSTGAIRGWS
jgi:hypothetical protein